MNLLLLTLLLPLAGFFVAAASAAPIRKRRGRRRLHSPLAAFAAVARVDLRRSTSTPAEQTSATDVLWIHHRNIHFHLGVDGISLWLILLSTFLTPICVLISEDLIKDRRQGVLRVTAAARIRTGRRLFGARSVPVLRVLGSRSGADVLPGRHLGPRARNLCRGEVLSVHDGRFGADAGRHHLPATTGLEPSTISRFWRD